MTTTPTTQQPTAAHRFQVDEMTPGLYRVTLVGEYGEVINRRRDVAADRIAAVKQLLVDEEDGRQLARS